MRQDPRRADLMERAWPKMATGEGGCWLWTGSKDGKGYGKIKADGQPRLAHRVLYELLVGPIPDGLELDHLCRVTSCVNPAHLEPVTHAENMARSSTATKTECKRGHPFNDENTLHSGGARFCRTCRRERQRRYRGSST